MKKILFLVFSAALVLTTFNACEKESTDSEDNTENTNDNDTTQTDTTDTTTTDTTNNGGNNNGGGNTSAYDQEIIIGGQTYSTTFGIKSTNDPVNVTYSFGSTNPFTNIQFITDGDVTAGTRPITDWQTFGNDLMSTSEIYVLVVYNGSTWVANGTGSCAVTVDGNKIGFTVNNITLISQSDFTTTLTVSASVELEE